MRAAEKAVPSIEKACDYLVKLITDIFNIFPAGKLPPCREDESA